MNGRKYGAQLRAPAMTIHIDEYGDIDWIRYEKPDGSELKYVDKSLPSMWDTPWSLDDRNMADVRTITLFAFQSKKQGAYMMPDDYLYVRCPHGYGCIPWW